MWHIFEMFAHTNKVKYLKQWPESHWELLVQVAWVINWWSSWLTMTMAVAVMTNMKMIEELSSTCPACSSLLAQGKHMDWKHLKSATSPPTPFTRAQSESVIQAGKALMSLVAVGNPSLSSRLPLPVTRVAKRVRARRMELSIIVTVATDCRIKSSQLDAILITLVVYDHLVVTIGPLLGGGGSLTRYLSLIS